MGFEYTTTYPTLAAGTIASLKRAVRTLAGVVVVGSLDNDDRLDFRYDHRPARPTWPEDFSVYVHPTNCWVVFYGGTPQDHEDILAAVRRIFAAVGQRVMFEEA